jgi:glycosyltransferase involved in cell wall biosynthesis
VPVLVSERSDPAFFPIARSFGVLRRGLYPRADAVVVQSEQARRFFSGAVRERTVVIPNPVLPAQRQEPAPPGPGRTVVSLGRLSKVKGFDLLIDAFARIAPEHPDWSLEIWGEGPERPRLEKMAADKGLGSRLRLPGHTSSPQEKLSRADLFVLSSRVEGFPNALCEAMASGLPVVAVDCPSGPRQIIRDGVDGILVAPDDAAALARGMNRLMESPELARRLASRAPDVVQRFALDRVLGLWEAALEGAVRRRRT